MEAERGVRGGLRRSHESCLVNAIVRQAWEAAHGRRRDLVVGITGPDGFSAHAWLQGDPVPAADEAPIDASVLQASGGKRPTKPQKANRRGDAGRDGSGSPTAFNELLRRGAPDYLRDRSRQVT
jgi:hypothetical protein